VRDEQRDRVRANHENHFLLLGLSVKERRKTNNAEEQQNRKAKTIEPFA
jgi:hypothetical protein